MGRPLLRRRTSKTSHRAELNATLCQTIEAVAATNPSTEAAAVKALKTAITRTAATAGPELAELAGPPSVFTLPIVFVDGVEVTQAIQDMNQTVPLVSGKKTVVRVYVNYAPSAKDVRGELVASRSLAGPWTTIPSIGMAKLDPSRTGHTLAGLRDRRRNLAYSLNFAIPDALTGPGPLWVRLSRVTGTDGLQLPLFSFFPKQVTFAAGAPLRVRLIRIRYTSGSPAVTYLPTATDQANIASWLPRAYPTNALQMTVTTVDAGVPAPFEAASINAQLAGIRAQDRAAGTDGRTHYFGLVSDGGFFMRGLAAGIPATSPQPSTVASGPTGSGTWGWDTDGSYGDWYTGHELGHTFGRFHAEFCGAVGGAPYPYPDGQLSDADEAFEGLDVGDPALGFPMAVMPGTEWHDVMTYCAKEWLSPFTYRGIMDRLVAEDALGPGTNAGPTPGEGLVMDAAEMQVHVVAAVNLTQRTARIASALPLPADGHEAAGVPDDGGPTFVVQVLDAAGGVLHSQPAPFLPSACSIEGEDQTGLVDTVVPNVAGAAAVELLLDGEMLDRFAVGDGAVAAQLVAPAEAGLVAGAVSGPTITLNWDAPDAPAGQRYIVQVSADGGASWNTLAAGTPATSLEVDRDDFPGATGLEVRITATSGFGQPSVVTEHVDL